MLPLKTNLWHGIGVHAVPLQSDTHILIVEPDRGVSLALSFMLTARGYEHTRAVRSAMRGLALAERFQPSLVFLDIELPGTESLTLARKLRQDAQRSVRLIALTRDSEHPLREEARVAGFERFLVKPVAAAEVDKILNRAPSTA